jgi:tyrosine-protein phosphatase SIW14
MKSENDLVPLGFSSVRSGIYRSAYPASKVLPFLSQLNLKAMVSLHPQDIRSELEDFCANNSIKLYKFDLKHNQDPFLVMSEETMRMVLNTVEDPANQPLLIFCTGGKVKTSCAVGCLRKRSKWSIASIMAEFEQFTEPEGTLCDMQFIDSFEAV